MTTSLYAISYVWESGRACLFDCREQGNDGIDFVAQLGHRAGQNAACLQTLFGGVERGHAVGEHAVIYDNRACAVNVGSERVQALKRVNMAADIGEKRHRIGTAGLRQAVDGGLGFVRLAGCARHKRVVSCAAHAGNADVGKRHTRQRDDQNENDDAQNTDGLLVLALARAGLE